MKILVSGFAPFDGDATNPSQELLAWLATQRLEFELATVLLPVSFAQAHAELAQAIRAHQPDAVVATGLAKNRSELTVERIGINWVDARIPDNDGVTLRAQRIDRTGPDGLFSRLPVSALVRAAEAAGVPARISSSAGEYVCNYLLYQLLHTHPQLPAGFVHLQSAQMFPGILAMLNLLAREPGLRDDEVAV